MSRWAVIIIATAIGALSALLFPEFLFSPGKVSRVHADTATCLTCHTPFGKASGGTCSQSGCHEPTWWEKKKGVTKPHTMAAGCLRCHTEHTGENGKITFTAAHDENVKKSDCSDCHILGTSHTKTTEKRCSKCHSDTAWRPALFTHSGLKPGERCSSCHKKLPNQHVRSKSDCKECHSTKAWKPATFKHSMIDVNGPCIKCHNGIPDKHFATSADCKKCHTTKAWKPALFKHKFPMDHEARRAWPCEACHPYSVERYDCYGRCHRPLSVRAEHLEEGILSIENCIKCHPTGREHERRSGGGWRSQDGGKDDGKYDGGKYDGGKDDDD